MASLINLFSKKHVRTQEPKPARAIRRRRLHAALEKLEDRRLLAANLQLLPASGLVVYGGSSVDNVLEVSFDGTNYTFSDSAETINLDPDLLAAGGTGSGTNSVSFDPAAVDAMFGNIQLIRVNANAGDDTITVNSFRPGAEGLDIRNNASQGNDVVNINGDIGSGALPTLDEVKFAGEQINLDASVWTDGQGVDVTGPLNVISGARTINAGVEGVTFSETVDGPGSLTVVGGFVGFEDVVGGTTPLEALDVTGDALVMGAATVGAGDMVLEADTFVPQGPLGGSGELTIRPRTPGSDLAFNPDDLDFILPGFTFVTLGSVDTGTLTIESDGDNTLTTGSLNVQAPLRLIATEIVVKDSIDKEANQLIFRTDSLQFIRRGTAIGSGAVLIEKLNVGGTLLIDGDLGRPNGPNLWGLSELFVFAPGSSVEFVQLLRNNITDFGVLADVLLHEHSSAISVEGDLLLTVTTASLGGGLFSSTGDISVFGQLELGGSLLLKASGGQTIFVDGPILANGNNVIVRGDGGPLAFVDIGDVIGAADFRIDSGGARTAQAVNLNDVDAQSVIVKADLVALGGDVQATAGAIDLFGPVSLLTDSSLASSGNNGIRVNGTIDGDRNLLIDSADGVTVLGGVVGGVTPLMSLTVNAGDKNFINRDITVEVFFQMIVGESIVDGDLLTVRGLITALQAGGFVLLEADFLTVQTFPAADSVVLVENGTP